MHNTSVFYLQKFNDDTKKVLRKTKIFLSSFLETDKFTKLYKKQILKTPRNKKL